MREDQNKERERYREKKYTQQILFLSLTVWTQIKLENL